MDRPRLRSADRDVKGSMKSSKRNMTNQGKSSLYETCYIDQQQSDISCCESAEEDAEIDKNNKDFKENLAGLAGDWSSISLLMLLYVLQGIPLGLAGSIPYLLSSSHVSYKNQAIFSFVYWPFSMKLLWAPIVDSVFLPAFGRRKSWLVPTQYFIALFMFLLSRTDSVASLMNPLPGVSIDVTLLAVMFFLLNFLAATQDIAVDGWALTMLSKRNVGWVATCNAVGQTAGYFAGNIIFLTLQSAEFCNKYLRFEPQPEGILNLAGYLQFWSVVFLVVTTLVMLLKHETGSTFLSKSSANKSMGDGHESVLETLTEETQSVFQAYKQLWRVIQLPAVMSLIITLLTMKIGFAAADSVTSLKLIEEGVPKENLAMLAVPMVAIDLVLPIFITRSISRHRPLDVILRAVPPRLILGLVFAAIVWWVPSTKLETGEYPTYLYGILLISSALHQVAIYFMFVPIMAFFAKVSDPAIGGTYMTLLNTVSNFGGNWPTTLVLSLVDCLTWKGCINSDSVCSTSEEECITPVKSCTILDGYYVESIACFVIGIIWLIVRSSKVRRLQDLPQSQWSCS